MNPQFCPSPTIAETKALASLPKEPLLKNEHMRELLHEILAFCQRPDIHGFLFTKDPIQVSHYLKPDILATSFQMSYAQTRISEEGRHENTITDHATGSFVLFPAFVSQGISFGFAVSNSIYSPVKLWEAQTGLSYYTEVRYVRDNNKRILLSVGTAEDANFLEFQYTRQISTTCHFRIATCFQRSKFIAVTAGNRYNMEDILGTMWHIHSGLEYRRCPLCNLSDGVCQCPLPDYHPRHPFDREMVERNVQMHIGSFQGSANVVFLKDGKPSQSASVGSRMTYEGKHDRELAEEFRRLVIHRHYRTQNPWHSVLSTTEDRNEKAKIAISVQDTKTGSGTEDLMRTLGIDVNPTGSSSNLHDSFQYLSQLLGDVDAGGEKASDETSGWMTRSQLMSELMESSTQTSMTAMRRNTANGVKKYCPKASRLLRKTSKAGTDLDEIQKMKEERRKEQNRMSARKSNQKKKAFNDALKESLTEAHERAAALRARELKLRKENLELRKRVEEVE